MDASWTVAAQALDDVMLPHKTLLIAPSSIDTARGILTHGVESMLTIYDGADELTDALASVRDDRSYISTSAAKLVLGDFRDKITPPSRLATLSSRESEILQGLVDGLSTKAIARRLGISPKTAEAHQTRLFAHLQVRRRAQAIAIALAHDKAAPSRGEAGTLL